MTESTAEKVVDAVAEGAGIAEKLFAIFGGALPFSGYIESGLNALAAAPAIYADATAAVPVMTKIANGMLTVFEAAKSDKPVDPAVLAGHQSYMLWAQECFRSGWPLESAEAQAIKPANAEIETLL